MVAFARTRSERRGGATTREGSIAERYVDRSSYEDGDSSALRSQPSSQIACCSLAMRTSRVDTALRRLRHVQ